MIVEVTLLSTWFIYTCLYRIDVHMYVISQWWVLGGKETEESIFTRLCSKKLDLSAGDCSVLREIALLSSDAILYGHYCPEGDYPACWLKASRDDRLGGLHQLGNNVLYDIVAS